MLDVEDRLSYNCSLQSPLKVTRYIQRILLMFNGSVSLLFIMRLSQDFPSNWHSRGTATGNVPKCSRRMAALSCHAPVTPRWLCALHLTQLDGSVEVPACNIPGEQSHTLRGHLLAPKWSFYVRVTTSVPLLDAG